MTLESQLQQKVEVEPPGPIHTKLYPHPQCSEIAAAEDGSVWTLWTKGRNQHNQPKLSNTWRLVDTYCGAKFRAKQSITVPAPVARQLCSVSGNVSYRINAGRLNLECYLGRVLEPHEVCCHGPLGNIDHSKKNLSADCQLNNIIDEVVAGRIPTTPESIKRAIARLEAHLSTTTN
jgi:hypothetical protein